MSQARPPGPPPGRSWPPRRDVLVGAALLAVSACTRSSGEAGPRRTADQRLAARCADQVQDLAERYAATVAAHLGLRSRLAPLAAEHGAHATALAALLPPSTQASPSPSTTSSSSPSPSGTRPAVPDAPEAALAALVEAERSAARERRAQSMRAGAELARLLASIAACESAHVALLSERG